MSATRSAINGVAASWASPAALGAVCACGARGEHEHCPATRQAGAPNGARRTPAADGLRGVVLEALRAHEAPMSGRAVLKTIPRRAVAVRAALRELEAAGLAVRGDDGWRVVR